MNADFWNSRWEQQQIGFHQHDVNAMLQQHIALLQLAPADVILVPLCGKSLDMVWLRDTGAHVVGAELSRIAVEDFFAENAIEHTLEPGDRFQRYASRGLEILQGDFFDLRSADLSGAHAVYDRAALIALPPEMRVRYADFMASLLPAGSRVLLIAIEYDQNEMNGPPFSVPPLEVETLFGHNFEITQIVSEEALEREERFKKRGLTWLREQCYLLVRR